MCAWKKMTNVRYGTLACLKITFFFKGDGFLLGFNPYISPEENQVNYGDDQDLPLQSRILASGKQIQFFTLGMKG